MSRTFQWVGGSVSLDFVNTVSWGRVQSAEERLVSYEDVARWASEAGVLGELDRLLDKARAHPSDAECVYHEALRLRATVRGVFHPMARRGFPDPDRLRELNEAIGRTLGRLRITPRGSGFVWAWSDPDEDLARPLWPVAWSAAQLLTAGERLPRLKTCGNPDCGWLFLDESRRGNRRWCDMRVCGNREKARRHYRRMREQRVAS